MKRYTAVGFIVIVAIVGVLFWQRSKHPSDAEIIQQVIGTWTHGDHEMAMNTDGSFSESFYSNKRGTLTLTGTWQIQAAFLIFTITNATGRQAHAPIGYVSRWKITHIDDHQLVYGANGNTNTLTR